jgi:hypothetical protein
VLEEDEAETYDGYDAGFDYRPGASGTYFLEVVGDKADYGLRAFADAAPDIRTAAEIEVGQTRDLSFFYGGDVDTYGVDLVGGRSYDFAANDSSIDVALLDANGDVLARNPFGAIQGFEAPSTGRYFLRAEDEYGRSHSEYTLSVRESGGGPTGPRVVRLTEGDDDFSEYDLPRTVFGLGGDDDIGASGPGAGCPGARATTSWAPASAGASRAAQAATSSPSARTERRTGAQATTASGSGSRAAACSGAGRAGTPSSRSRAAATYRASIPIP